MLDFLHFKYPQLSQILRLVLELSLQIVSYPTRIGWIGEKTLNTLCVQGLIAIPIPQKNGKKFIWSKGLKKQIWAGVTSCSFVFLKP